MTGSSRSDR